MIILSFRFQGTSASALRAGMMRPGTVKIRGVCAVAARDKGIIRSRGTRHQPGREVCR